MKIAIGTAQFDSKYGILRGKNNFNLKLKNDLLRLAIKFKIKTIDTASSYKNVENQLGNLGINKFDIITKLPKRKKKNIKIEKWLINCLEDSIKKLKVKRIYGLLIHYPQDLNKENIDLNLRLKRQIKSLHKLN